MKHFAGPQEFVQALALPSGRVLIAVNLSMIVGVVWFGWSVLDIVFLYWVENLVVGAINVFRMLLASSDLSTMTGVKEKMAMLEAEEARKSMRVVKAAGGAMKFFMIPFFIVHYGGFCYGHGVFVLAMFGDDGMMGTGGGTDQGFRDLLTPTLWLAIATLATSHLYSFFTNFLAGGEYKRTHASMLMMRPYGRIVALHVTILFGAFLTAIFDSPIGLLVILVITKTAADLALHKVERNKLALAPE